jgi:hypothetical protein
VAHLGAGDANEFVELDEAGTPVLEAGAGEPRVQTKKKTSRKKFAAAGDVDNKDARGRAGRKARPAGTEGDTGGQESSVKEGGSETDNTDKAAKKPVRKKVEKKKAPAKAE